MMSTVQPTPVTEPSWISSTSVAATAMTMPAVETWLPRRAVVGDDSPLSARMKQTEAIRYHRVSWFALICRPLSSVASS